MTRARSSSSDTVNLRALLDSATKSVSDAVSALRKQAPAARMIGEMTARFVSRDVARRLGFGAKKSPGDDGR